jgi:hypothetical protein
MKSPNVPHDSFSEGFNVGYQLIKGINAGIPRVRRAVPVPMVAQRRFFSA